MRKRVRPSETLKCFFDDAISTTARLLKIEPPSMLRAGIKTRPLPEARVILSAVLRRHLYRQSRPGVWPAAVAIKLGPQPHWDGPIERQPKPISYVWLGGLLRQDHTTRILGARKEKGLEGLIRQVEVELESRWGTALILTYAEK